MLDALRRGANSWPAKFLMAVLVVSFMIWGVRYSDTATSGRTLVSVGGQNISVDRYERLFNTEVRRLSRQFNQQIDPKVAHRLGVDQQVFSGLLVDAHAHDLNLGVGQQSLLDDLAQAPALQGPGGTFSKSAFVTMLSQTGQSEASFFENLRRDTIHNQLVGTLAEAIPATKTLAEAFNQFENEQRTIDYFVVPVSKAPAVAAPDDAKLKEYFEAHKDEYRAPEYRAIGVLLATPDDIKGSIAVSDDEVKAAYEAQKDTFGTPEKRHVLLMSFQDKAMAEKAMAALKSGKDFLAVAKEMGLNPTDIDKGLIPQKVLLDKVVGAAAFKLDKDKTSDIIEGALTFSIAKVTEVQPAMVQTFDQVKAGIKDKIARQRAQSQLLDMRSKVEDARAGGAQLKEIAPKLGLRFVQVASLDRDGKTPDGKPASSIPIPADVLKLAFDPQTDVGVETDPVDMGPEGWAWVEVTNVTASRQKALDEVKADVQKAYAESEANAELAKIARGLADRAGKGEDLAALAKEGGGEVKTAKAVTRNGKVDDLTPAVVQLAFSLPQGGASSLPAADDRSRIVFRLAGITPAAPLDDAKRKTIMTQLGAQGTGAILAAYTASLEKTYGLNIDQALFKQVTGTDQGGMPDDQGDQ